MVEQAGSVAGFASVIGLAILSALYFSQARDLRRLREWAGRAPERAAEGQPGAVVPGRVVAVPQQRPGAPAPATPAATPNGETATPQAGDGAKPQEAAAATNGDAAPAVSAQDKDSEGEGDEAKEGTATAAKPGMPAPASAAAAAAGAGTKSVTGPAAPGGAAPAAAPGTAPAGSAPPAAAPGSAPAGPPGSAPGTSPASAPDGAPASTPAGSPGSAPAGAPGSAAPASAAGAAAGAAAAGAASAPAGPPGAPRSAATPQRPPGSVLPPRTGTLPPVRRFPSSSVGPAQTGVLGSAPPPKKRNPVYVVLAVAGVLVLGAAAAIGVPALINGSKDDNSPSATSANAITKSAKTKKAAPVAPDKITVAVLNGTSIPGLAAQVGDRVDAEGFTLGTVSNASQTQGQRANSVAMYASGHRRDAIQVARKLGIRNVAPADANTQQIAGDASVVVIVGSDKTQ